MFNGPISLQMVNPGKPWALLLVYNTVIYILGEAQYPVYNIYSSTGKRIPESSL